MKKNIFYSSFLLLIAGLTVFAFSRFSNFQEVNSIEINKINEIDFNDSNNILLDVRSLNEYNQGHIPGSKNIDVMNFAFESAIKKQNKNANIYVYCKSGSRSIKAYYLLKANGFNKITNLQGGIQNFKGNIEK